MTSNYVINKYKQEAKGGNKGNLVDTGMCENCGKNFNKHDSVILSKTLLCIVMTQIKVQFE